MYELKKALETIPDEHLKIMGIGCNTESDGQLCLMAWTDDEVYAQKVFKDKNFYLIENYFSTILECSAYQENDEDFSDYFDDLIETNDKAFERYKKEK